ncbi:MAG: ABC transporter ATP-binding protein [Alphaproteobacteria bacterium]
MEVQLRGITKRFATTLANDDIDLTFRSGEILGLLGENGAGKTTLMNILYGLYKADAGDILVDGQLVRFDTPKDAIAAGIGMVHQHFMLVPVFTVAENVVLGVEPTGVLDSLSIGEAREQVRAISGEYRLEVDPDAVVEELPVGLQQRVEIIKILFRSAQLLIFDEPTSVLTPQEVTEFFEVVRALRDAGKAIVFITHKLGEVIEIADRIQVLRNGAVVGERDPATVDDVELAEMMVGRPVELVVDKRDASPGDILLDTRGLQVLDDRGEVAVDDMNLTVRSGEIVGVAGVQGNGQTELVEAVAGLRTPAAGRISLLGRDITGLSPRRRHQLSMAHVPEDRQRSGIIGTFTVAENMVLDAYYEERYASGIRLKWDNVNERAAQLVSDFDVRSPSIFTSAESLSGGNQQKLVVARELSRDVKLIVASQPTRGIDVGSIEYIHKRIVAARDRGVGALIVSTELDEIMALADRILVMYRGRVVAEFEGGAAEVTRIGLAMAGVKA